MRWVSVHAHFDVWAGGGPAPSFCITSDDDGVAFLEIAKTPELLVAPVSDPADPWNLFFSAIGSDDGSVAAVQIPLVSGRAEYTLPTAVWEHLREVAMAANPSDRRLYYRVKARTSSTTTGGVASHTDAQVTAGRVPFLIVEPISADLQATAPVDDPAAVAHLGLFSRLWLAIVQATGSGDPDYRALQRLLAHPTYRSASDETRAKVLRLFVYCGSHGRALFEQLLDLRVQTGSQITEPGLFYRDERNEGTTLDHLLALWDITPDRRVTVALSELIYEVLRELVDPPGQINQGAAGTCTVTSIQSYTIVRNPAEYARWCRYILDRRQRHRVRLANGDTIRCNAEAFDLDAWQTVYPNGLAPNWQMTLGRTYSERGIQAALMAYGNFRLTYDPENDRFTNWLGTAYGSGLWEFEISRVIEAIFNQPWLFDFGGGSRTNPNRATAAANAFAHLNGGGLPIILTMDWGGGGHAVLGLRVENNRLIFRNPQYRGSYPVPGMANGAAQANPSRTIHNLRRAEESIDLPSLQAVIRGYCRESSSLSDRGYTAAEIPAHLQGAVAPTA